MIVEKMLRDSSYLKHLSYLRETLQDRAAAMCDALRMFFPENKATFVVPEGGYYLWLRIFPDKSRSVDIGTLRRIANRRGVDFLPGDIFLAPATDLQVLDSDNLIGQHIRLSFAYYGKEDIQEGVRRLAIARSEA